MAWYGKRLNKLNLTQQKHAFTNQKCTTSQNKHKKTKARFSRVLWHPAWKWRGPILNLVLHKFVLLTYVDTYQLTYSPGTHTQQEVPKAKTRVVVSTFYNETNNNNHFYSPLSGTTRVSRYQKKHSPTHRPDHDPIFISFFHILRSIASTLFKLRAWQSFCTTSLYVPFGLPLGLEPSTSYSIHFFDQSVSSFRNTCPYHCNLFCCSTKIISSIPSLSVNSLLGTPYFTLTLHIQ